MADTAIKRRRPRPEMISDAHIISETKNVSKSSSEEKKQTPIENKKTESSDKFDPIPEIGDSPIVNEAVIERKVEETFLQNNHTPNNNDGGDPGYTPPTPNPNAGGFYQETPNPGIKDFSIEDPELAFLQQKQQHKVELDQEMANESTNMIGDMLLDGFAMIAPELAEAYYGINEAEIKKLELEGKLQKGSLDYIKQINTTNQGAVKFDKTKKNFVKGPLYKVLEIQGVKGDPTSILIIAIVFVIGMMWFESWKIKKSNDSLISKLVELNTKSVSEVKSNVEEKQAA